MTSERLPKLLIFPLLQRQISYCSKGQICSSDLSLCCIVWVRRNTFVPEPWKLHQLEISFDPNALSLQQLGIIISHGITALTFALSCCCCRSSTRSFASHLLATGLCPSSTCLRGGWAHMGGENPLVSGSVELQCLEVSTCSFWVSIMVLQLGHVSTKRR